MDKNTLKSLIVGLRESGKSFQAISEILERDYNTKKSRQAICNMYNRIISDKYITDNSKEILLTSEIMQLSALGLTVAQIRNKIGKRTTEYLISRVIAENETCARSILSNQVAKVVNILKRNGDMDDMRQALRFKDEVPSNATINKLIKIASTEILRSRALDLMVKVINITDDMSIVSEINKRHKFNVSLKEVSSAMNSQNKPNGK